MNCKWLFRSKWSISLQIAAASVLPQVVELQVAKKEAASGFAANAHTFCIKYIAKLWSIKIQGLYNLCNRGWLFLLKNVEILLRQKIVCPEISIPTLRIRNRLRIELIWQNLKFFFHFVMFGKWIGYWRWMFWFWNRHYKFSVWIIWLKYRKFWKKTLLFIATRHRFLKSNGIG